MPGNEDIVYRPSGGTPRTISVQVYRRGITINAAGMTVAVIEIDAQNDSTLGIASDEMSVGADEIEVAFRPGGTARTFKLPSQEPTGDLQVLHFILEGRGE